jgi:hypothetical protein
MGAHNSFLIGAIGAAIEIPSCFHAVTYDAAAAMLAGRCQGMDSAFETVVVMRDAINDDFEVFVVFVSANFAFIHKYASLLRPP